MGTTAEKKLEALEFWNKYGLSATRDAFAVSRSTLYAWRAKHRSGGLSALHDRSRAPRAPRRRSWPPGLLEELRALRRARPSLGAEKLRVLLEPVCFARRWPCPSPRTLVRMLAAEPHPLERAFPVPIRHVLTDNGSKFQGRFAETLARRGIVHWHTYPNCPKMNAHVERFNRTLQEDFVEGDEDLLWTDRPRFNRRLRQYLGWYNRERPHHSLGLRTPVAVMSQACVTESMYGPPRLCKCLSARMA